MVDCAHGATYHIAPHVFHELGADVVAIGVQPDGFNINRDVRRQRTRRRWPKAVKAQGADLGIALDGDGDRLMMADASGQRLRRRPVAVRHRRIPARSKVCSTAAWSAR